ncbi:MAG: hypothetical protein IPJ34_44010 [Myxococcales bacterium]|nr:hypothetical protein [Myxococcales bacterium]
MGRGSHHASRAAALVVLLAAGCARLLDWDDLRVDPGSDASLEAAVDTGFDAAQDAAETGPTSARWPERPAGATTPGGGKTLFWVARRIFLGSQDHDGAPVTDAWRGWGYDLDGRCTTEASDPAVHCKPVGPPSGVRDGDGCRDNNYGARFMGPVVAGTKRAFEDEFMTSLVSGAATWVLRLDDVGDGDDDPYVPGALYVAASTATPPKFDGSETRAILSTSVVDGDLEKPVVRFPKGYLRDGTWVSGELAPADLRLPFGKRNSTPLSFRAVVLTTRLAPDRTTATSGVVAGVLSVPAFVAFFTPLAADFKLCPGDPIYTGIVDGIARYPDLSLDAPSLQDPSKTCDGISMGLGFELAPIPPPTTVTPPPTPTAVCGDAGTD